MLLAPTPRWSDDRIALFPLTPDLVSDAYIGWLNEPEVNRYLEIRYATQTRADVEGFVAAMAASERDLLLGISDLGLGRHVGNIRLGPIDRNHGLGEIGIMIGDREVWGRGVGTAAIRLIAGIARHELGLRKLSAGCYAVNEGSRRAFEKAGFTLEARRPAHAVVDGVPEDQLLLGMIVDPQ